MKKTVCIAGMLFFATMAMAQRSGSPTSAPTKAITKQQQISNMKQDFAMPVASPKITVTQQFSTSSIGLEYSRPSVKGRKVFGEMVAFGRPWRTGANAATTITFGEEEIGRASCRKE